MSLRLLLRPAYLVFKCLAFAVFFVAVPGNAQDGAESLVRRFNPRTRELVPVDSQQIIPGKIYNHFSPRLGRYVWAFAKEGGSFSYSLGPGSTELPENFDLVTSVQETEELVEEEAADWVKASRREGRKVLVRLQADGDWRILRFSSIRSHFDLSSGYRREWHGPHEIRVCHTYGYVWQRVGDRYFPAYP